MQVLFAIYADRTGRALGRASDIDDALPVMEQIDTDLLAKVYFRRSGALSAKNFRSPAQLSASRCQNIPNA